jgi:manganese/iron transport system ATP-binding protein
MSVTIFPQIKDRPGRHSITHEPGTAILKVEHLGVNYGEVKALEDISFTLEQADRLAVIGPNGAGKSTLFKVIAGLLAPTTGTATIAGHESIEHLCISYIPQRSQVDWNFPVSVANVVMMGRTGRLGLLRWPGKTDHEIVQRALEMVKLSDLQNRQISELSGGQQQRMFIAQALAQQAELMLLDEPFSGLDLPSQEELFALLDGLKQNRVTVMVALHDLKLAAERFDKALVLNHRVVAFGAPRNVLREDVLQDAYSGKLQLMPSSDQLTAFDDTCCGDEEPHNA